MKYEREVARGAAHLDVKDPGWDTRINLEELDLANCSTCVLGQLFGDYDVGKGQLGIWGAHQFGFDVPTHVYSEYVIKARTDKPDKVELRDYLDEKMAPEWDALRLAWTEEIKRRRE